MILIYFSNDLHVFLMFHDALNNLAQRFNNNKSFFRFLFYTMINEISEKSHFSSVICDSNDNKLHIAFSSSYDDCSDFYFQLLSSVIYTCINILCLLHSTLREEVKNRCSWVIPDKRRISLFVFIFENFPLWKFLEVETINYSSPIFFYKFRKFYSLHFSSFAFNQISYLYCF